MTRNSQLSIHIGAPKTGTTLVQRYLEQVGQSTDARFLYPPSILRGHGHHDLAFQIAGGYPDWAVPGDKSVSQIGKALQQDCARFTGDVVLSSENFFLFPEPIKLYRFLEEYGLVDRYALRIVVYLRRQDHAMTSWYNQSVKALGYCADFEAFSAQNRDLWDYKSQLQRWSDAFGDGALVVRCFDERWKKGSGLLEDFCEVIGQPVYPGAVPEIPENISIPRDLLEFQRQLNRLPLEPVRKRAFHRQLMDLTRNSASLELFNDQPLMNCKQKLAMLQDYADCNRWVAEKYFGCEELFPISGLNERSQQQQPYAGLSQESLAMILGWLLAHIQELP